ncbi:MAG: hypothetical protein ACXW3T_15860 [Rhodoplanes sp.]|jgi:hypothetical protein
MQKIDKFAHRQVRRSVPAAGGDVLDWIELATLSRKKGSAMVAADKRPAPTLARYDAAAPDDASTWRRLSAVPAGQANRQRTLAPLNASEPIL